MHPCLKVLVDNGEILAELASDGCKPDNKTLCIGAAAISITSEREQLIDFLPSYYMLESVTEVQFHS